MALNTNIALGVRPIELANPLAQYGQLAQIQAARNQNAMAQLQMREAEAAAQEKNMLRRLDPTAADYEAQLFKVSPQLGINFRKEQAATEASKAQTAASVATAAKAKQEILGQALRDISQRPSDANITAHTEDIQSSPLFSTEEKAKALVTQQTLLAMPFEQRQAYLASQGAKPSDLKPTTQTVNRGGATEIIQTPAFGGAPMAVGSYADVPLPADVEAQKLRIAKAGASNINLPPQEKAFEGELGKGQAEELLKGRAAARDAAAIIDTVNTGRDIMKSGMITGAGADFLVNFNQALKTAGIDAGYADAAANSQAFTANMAGNVGKLIKQFGAGTGLSDADREFAKDMAGGRISLDAKAINKILDINERAARNVISRHNKDVKGIKTNIPLEVEMPVEVKPAAAAKVVTNPQFPGFSVGKP
jgi:hypothetical protein